MKNLRVATPTSTIFIEDGSGLTYSSLATDKPGTKANPMEVGVGVSSNVIVSNAPKTFVIENPNLTMHEPVIVNGGKPKANILDLPPAINNPKSNVVITPEPTPVLSPKVLASLQQIDSPGSSVATTDDKTKATDKLKKANPLFALLIAVLIIIILIRIFK